MKRSLLALVAVATAVGLVGCAGAEPATLDRPAALAELPEVELTGPGATGVGGSPVFTWRPVDSAAGYVLAVADAAGPVWGWHGDATEVRFGGYDREPAAGVGAQRLRAAACWSVVALDADGGVLAVSRQRAVSPDDTAPDPLGGAPASEAPAAWTLDGAGLCALVSDDEAAAFLEGELAGPGETQVEGGGRAYYCRWERADDDLLDLSLELSRARLLPGKEEEHDAWMQMLTDRYDECLDTLVNERSCFEAIFRHTEADGSVWMYHLQLVGTEGSGLDTSNPVDAEHEARAKQVKERGWEDLKPVFLLAPQHIMDAMAHWGRTGTAH